MDFGRDPTDLWNPHNLSRKITAVRSQAGYDPIPATALSQAVVGFGRAELYRQASVEFPDRNPRVRLPLTPQNGVVHIQGTEIHVRFTLDSFSVQIHISALKCCRQAVNRSPEQPADPSP
jgi:hypothetical protein